MEITVKNAKDHLKQSLINEWLNPPHLAYVEHVLVHGQAGDLVWMFEVSPMLAHQLGGEASLPLLTLTCHALGGWDRDNCSPFFLSKCQDKLIEGMIVKGRGDDLTLLLDSFPIFCQTTNVNALGYALREKQWGLVEELMNRCAARVCIQENVRINRMVNKARDNFPDGWNGNEKTTAHCLGIWERARENHQTSDIEMRKNLQEASQHIPALLDIACVVWYSSHHLYDRGLETATHLHQSMLAREEKKALLKHMESKTLSGKKPKIL